MPNRRPENFENRLDELRDAARQKDRVPEPGIHALDGPLPRNTAEALIGQNYYGLPILKPPVWEWMIPVYFFLGGLAGMSALIAAAAELKGNLALARAAMWVAGIGAILSPILLTWDLGRPLRFFYMLRVFKYQSPMSVGSWIVAAFGGFAIPGLILTEWTWRIVRQGGPAQAVQTLSVICVVGSAAIGIFLATYTGALIAVTAVPAWNLRRALLPFHFGMAALGSAVGLLYLVGFRDAPLWPIFVFAAAAETLTMVWMELRKHGAVDRALHTGKSGWLLRSGEALTGPVALVLALLGLVPAAAACFLAGALLARFGWISAGRTSACDPESVLASQRGAHPTCETSRPFLLTTSRMQVSRSSHKSGA